MWNRVGQAMGAHAAPVDMRKQFCNCVQECVPTSKGPSLRLWARGCMNYRSRHAEDWGKPCSIHITSGGDLSCFGAIREYRFRTMPLSAWCAVQSLGARATMARAPDAAFNAPRCFPLESAKVYDLDPNAYLRGAITEARVIQQAATARIPRRTRPPRSAAAQVPRAPRHVAKCPGEVLW
jgi:hypothetical protein